MSYFGRRNRRLFSHNEEKEIQITPFIDVVLVLLIIFMIASPIVLSGVEVDLPNGSSEQSAQNLDFLTVSLNKDGNLYLDEDSVTNSILVSSIKNKIGSSKDKTIFVRGDKMIKYGDIMIIVDILNRAGYSKTILVTNSAND